MNDSVAEGIVAAVERDKALFSPKTVKYLYKVCLFLSRRCCSMSNACGLPFCLLYLGNNHTQNLLHVAFSFLKTSQKKNMKKKGNILLWSFKCQKRKLVLWFLLASVGDLYIFHPPITLFKCPNACTKYCTWSVHYLLKKYFSILNAAWIFLSMLPQSTERSSLNSSF